jgi:hypothetical protein
MIHIYIINIYKYIYINIFYKYIYLIYLYIYDISIGESKPTHLFISPHCAIRKKNQALDRALPFLRADDPPDGGVLPAGVLAIWVNNGKTIGKP